jgi:DNA-binding transcriptional MerR regulator
MAKPPPKGLKISELAKQAGVSPPTVKHYLNEGLLPKPVKTGKTMSYYDPACVERIKLIKKLQKEKFLPLEMIKRALDAGEYDNLDFEVGLALAKSDKLSRLKTPVTEKNVAKVTGLSLSKIRRLESLGMIKPSRGESGKQYSALDLQIIEILRQREGLGLPFDYAVGIMEIFHKAMEKAVNEDVRSFMANIVGNIPTEKALRLIREADDQLDEYVVMVRHQVLRHLGRQTIRRMNRLNDRLPELLFLPLPADALPQKEPAGQKALYHLLAGNFDKAEKTAEAELGPVYGSAVAVIARLLSHDYEAAFSLVQRHFSKLQDDPLAAATVALAYAWQGATAKGFSEPIYLAKKAIEYIKHAETGPDAQDGSVAALIFQYVSGALFVMMPPVFDLHEHGCDRLQTFIETLEKGRVKTGRLPAWLSKMFKSELAPRVLANARRLQDLNNNVTT